MAENNSMLISDTKVFDGISEDLTRADVLVVGNKIEKVSDQKITPPSGAQRLDADGRVLMPGMSDAHWHMVLAPNTMDTVHDADAGHMYARAVDEAGSTLLRGFTTVRDMGGPAFGLKKAIDTGVIPGPRVFPSGALVSQTAGHGDFSAAYDRSVTLGGPRSRLEDLGIFSVADSVTEMQATVRDQLKRGASQIKLALGGGVISDTDPLDTLQYTADEITAAVQAAADWGTYVCTHVYSSEGIRRALEAGVRSIEHGHMATEETVEAIARHDAWLSLQPFQEGDNPLTPGQTAKAQPTGHWDRVARWAQEHGVRVAFGTDLLFQPGRLDLQSTLMTRFAKIFGPVGTLRIVTSGNAELMRMSGRRNPYGEAKLGVIAPGAWADLLVVNGNPLEDISILGKPQESLVVIMKDGRVFRDRLR